MCDGLKFESEQRGDPVIQPPSPVPGGLERDPSCFRVGFRNRLYEGSDHTAEASTRRQSGALAGRCVLHPPHSTLLLLSAEPAVMARIKSVGITFGRNSPQAVRNLARASSQGSNWPVGGMTHYCSF